MDTSYNYYDEVAEEETQDRQEKKDSRWLLKTKVREAAYRNKREVSLNEASRIINTEPRKFYRAIDTGVLHYSSPGKFLLLDILGWNQENYYQALPKDSPSWALDLGRDGHGCIANVFSEFEISYLSSICDQLYEEYKEDSTNPQTSFDLTYDKIYYLERMRWLWTTPLRFIIGHPIFDEISLRMFGTQNWLPYLYMGIFKHSGSLPTTCHRDVHWSVPENFQHMRFLCQIQLTPPNPGDGGLEFLPESHRLQKDRPMIHQYQPRTEGYRSFYGITPYDMNMHNIGVLHTVGSNTANILMKRLYIGIIPATDPALDTPFPTDQKKQEIRNYVHQAKEEYASLVS